MMVENSRYKINLDEIVDRVAECLKKEHSEDIRMFSMWLSKMFSDKKPEVRIDFPQKGGSRHMFAETAQRIKQDLLNEGMQQGLEKGKEQGLEKGREQGIEQGELNDKHEVLIRQLNLKFGLSDDEKASIRNVDNPELLDSALDAVVSDEDKKYILELLG